LAGSSSDALCSLSVRFTSKLSTIVTLLLLLLLLLLLQALGAGAPGCC
jgi:hypothetical protein